MRRRTLLLLAGLCVALPRIRAATFTVNSASDDGSSGTLRWAITQSNAGGAGNVINVGIGGTITLGSPLPIVANDVAVNGNGVTISGADLYQIFVVGLGAGSPATNVTLKDMSLVHGRAKGGVGKIGSAGPSGGGGLGAGGALFVNQNGNVSLQNVSFSANRAIGGAGGGVGANGNNADYCFDSSSNGCAGGGGGGGLDEGVVGAAGGSGGTVGQNGAAGGSGSLGGAGGSGGQPQACPSSGNNLQPNTFQICLSNTPGGAGGLGAGGGGGGGCAGQSSEFGGPIPGNSTCVGGSLAGAGGFGGGGGGGGANWWGGIGGTIPNSMPAGAGGFGGGGGGGDCSTDKWTSLINNCASDVAAGGFGGGAGGFGGATGVPNPPNTTNAVEFYSPPGSGGSGLGGAVFAAPGSTLAVVTGSIDGTNAVSAGAGGVSFNSTGNDGDAVAPALFLAAGSGITFSPGNGQTANVDWPIDGGADSGRTFSSFNDNGLAMSGAGTAVLSSTNSYNGPTVLAAGVLAAAGDYSLGSSSLLDFNGGTLRTGAGFSTSKPIRLDAGGGTLDPAGHLSIYSGAVSGTGPITIADSVGGGTVAFSGGAPTFHQVTLDNAALLVAGGLGAVPVTVAAGTGTLVNSNLNGGPSTAHDTGIFSGAGTLRFASVPSFGLVVDFSAANQPNSYAGGTIVDGVDLEAASGSVGALGGGPLTLLNAAYVDVSSETIAELSGNANTTVGIASWLAAGSDDRDAVYGGMITGNGTFAKIGRGVLTLSGSDSAATRISSGTLRLDGDSVFAKAERNSQGQITQITNTGGNLRIDPGAVLDLGGSNPVLNTTTNNGEIRIGTQALSIDGGLSGSGVLDMTLTPGTTALSFLNLTSTNDLTGQTLVVSAPSAPSDGETFTAALALGVSVKGPFAAVRAPNNVTLTPIYYPDRVVLKAGPMLAAPTLSAAASGISSITWTWNAVSGAASYNVYRGPLNAGGPDLNTPGTNLGFSGLGVNTQYGLTVAAVGTNGEGIASSLVKAYTLADPAASLAADAVFASSMTISWSANGNPSGTSYRVDYWTVGGSTTSVSTGTVSAALTGLAGGATYYARVVALNGDGIAAAAAGPISAVTSPRSGAPSLSVSAAGTTSLAWSWSLANATAFNFYPSTGGAAILFGNVNGWTQGGLSPNARYGGVVASTDTGGEGPHSAQAFAYTLAAAPSGLTLDGVFSSSVTASWSADSNPGGTDYVVQYWTAGGSTSSIETASLNAALTGLAGGATYYVQVLARNGDNVPSAAAGPLTAVTRPGAPAAPAGLAGTALGVSSITWSWDAVSTATAYDFYPSTGGAPIMVAQNSVTQTGLSPNVRYGGWISALGPGGESPPSLTVFTHTLAAPPSGLAATQIFASSMTLTWSANGNGSGTTYRVDYWTAGGSTTSVNAATEGGILTGLSGGASYYLQVLARNGEGTLSAPSAAVKVITLPAGEAAGAVGPGQGGTLAFNPAPGPATVTIPPNAFGVRVNVTVASPAPNAFPAGNAGAAALNGTGVGLKVTLDQSVQPNQPCALSIGYGGANLAGLDPATFLIARYDPIDNVWVPLVSTPDNANKRVTAFTSHFSLFQIMAGTPSTTVSTVKVFPNPFRPALGHTSVTFMNLPADAAVRIYTLLGEKVAELQANASGMAAWDGKNGAGADVASGVYFVHAVSAGGGHKTFKVAVQR